MHRRVPQANGRGYTRGMVQRQGARAGAAHPDRPFRRPSWQRALRSPSRESGPSSAPRPRTRHPVPRPQRPVRRRGREWACRPASGSARRSSTARCHPTGAPAAVRRRARACVRRPSSPVRCPRARRRGSRRPRGAVGGEDRGGQRDAPVPAFAAIGVAACPRSSRCASVPEATKSRAASTPSFTDPVDVLRTSTTSCVAPCFSRSETVRRDRVRSARAERGDAEHADSPGRHPAADLRGRQLLADQRHVVGFGRVAAQHGDLTFDPTGPRSNRVPSNAERSRVGAPSMARM